MPIRELRSRPGGPGAGLLGAGGRDDADAHAPGTGSISSWDLSTGVDGPGTRFALFVAGCPLRCLYCHNPETWRMRDGHVVHVDDVVAEVAKYRRFITAAGGGFTASGGEPLAQPAFVAELFARLGELGMHTALDTAGSVPVRAVIDRVLDHTDLVLLDIKSSDPDTFHTVTGGALQRTLDFARHLAERGVTTWVRFVLVPGLTDEPGNIAGVARIAASLGNVERVDVLPYHRLGVHKYDELGLPYPLADTTPPTEAALDSARAAFAAEGLSVY